MFNPVKSIVKRFARYIVDYAIAVGLQIVISILIGLQVPVIFQPVIAAIVSALGKLIRIKTSIQVPF